MSSKTHPAPNPIQIQTQIQAQPTRPVLALSLKQREHADFYVLYKDEKITVPKSMSEIKTKKS